MNIASKKPGPKIRLVEGTKFGRLTVLSATPTKITKEGKTQRDKYWFSVECECGTLFESKADHFRYGLDSLGEFKNHVARMARRMGVV